MANVRASAMTISMSSPSCSASASTTDAGRLAARLLPHFDTCMIRLLEDIHGCDGISSSVECSMVTAALRCAQRRVRVPLTFALVARLPIDIDRDPPDAGMLLALA